MTARYETVSKEETFALGESLGRKARPGDIYLLKGDLGAGKTAFSKGVAAGIGVKSIVTSPTFTIVNVYEDGRLPLYHFDAYRLEDESELIEIGYYEYLDAGGVCLIEWPEMIEESIPQDVVTIKISKDLSRGESFRVIEISEGIKNEDTCN